jgi:hypothetical protein
MFGFEQLICTFLLLNNLVVQFTTQFSALIYFEGVNFWSYFRLLLFEANNPNPCLKYSNIYHIVSCFQ